MKPFAIFAPNIPFTIPKCDHKYLQYPYYFVCFTTRRLSVDLWEWCQAQLQNQSTLNKDGLVMSCLGHTRRNVCCKNTHIVRHHFQPQSHEEEQQCSSIAVALDELGIIHKNGKSLRENAPFSFERYETTALDSLDVCNLTHYSSTATTVVWLSKLYWTCMHSY